MMLVRSLMARRRLIVSMMVAVAVFALSPLGERLPTRLLVVWDAGVVLHLILAWSLMALSGVKELRERAS